MNIEYKIFATAGLDRALSISRYNSNVAKWPNSYIIIEENGMLIKLINNQVVINNYSNTTILDSGYMIELGESKMWLVKENDTYFLYDIMNVEENGDIVIYGINGSIEYFDDMSLNKVISILAI